MRSRKIRSGLYEVTLDNGRIYTVRRRVDNPNGYWGDWMVRGPGMGLRGTFASSKRSCLEVIEEVQR